MGHSGDRAATQIGQARRRRLAEALRRAGGADRDRPLPGLLGRRAESVAGELAALAALVETVADPSPEWLLGVDELINDQLHSPLYNPVVHASELRATLFYLARPSDRIWQPSGAEGPYSVRSLSATIRGLSTMIRRRRSAVNIGS